MTESEIFDNADLRLRFWAHVDKGLTPDMFGEPWPTWRPGWVERVWFRLEGVAASNCWIWVGAKSPVGYGLIWSGFWTASGSQELLGSHRVAWVLEFGEIPAGALVLHRCDRRACVNPRHLFLGDQAENQADAVEKGRKAKKLDWRQVLRIRELAEAGRPGVEIAELFDVSPATISKISAGKIWRFPPLTYFLLKGLRAWFIERGLMAPGSEHYPKDWKA
jgi:hypothetical protein